MKLKSKKLEKKITTREKNIAAIISLGIMAVIIAIYIGVTFTNAYNNAKLNNLIENVPDGCVLMPSGVLLTREEDIEMYTVNSLKSEDLSKKEKETIIKYLSLQDIDTSRYQAYLDGDLDALEKPKETLVENEDTNSNKYTDLLVNNGIINDAKDNNKSESSLNMINGKPAISYRNLHEAEQGFGMSLGLYHYCDSLENYEMVNAYTVGTDFLQCVYAINIDGTPIQEGQDIEESEIKTITIKLSTNMEIQDMISVYNEYETQDIESLDDTDICKFSILQLVKVISWED